MSKMIKESQEEKQKATQDAIVKAATDQMVAEFLALVNNPAGIELSTVPDAYQLTISQFIEAFGEATGQAIMNAVPNNIMYQLAIIFTKSNLNRNEFLNRCLTWSNPNQARGVVADSLALLKGASRDPATRTSFLGLIRGQSGTVIYAGSLISVADVPESQQVVYFNPYQVVIGNDGTIETPFACQEYGEIPLLPGTKFSKMTDIPGWDSVEISPYWDQLPIVIGRDEMTDNELLNKADATLYAKSSNGFGAVKGLLLAATIRNSDGKEVPLVNNANTAINTSLTAKSFPFAQKVSNVYQVPACSTVIAVDMEDNQDYCNKVAEIIYANIAGFNPDYPIGCPEANKKTGVINVGTASSPWDYQFKFVLCSYLVIEFHVNYSTFGSVRPNLDKEIKSKIIEFFENGDTNYKPVTMGDTFGIQGFQDALAPLGMPPYSVSMNIKGQQPAQYICSPIWLQPITGEVYIYINE